MRETHAQCVRLGRSEIEIVFLYLFIDLVCPYSYWASMQPKYNYVC